MAGNLNEAQDLYEKLWRQAVAAFEQRKPRLDPFLRDRAGDQRRGVTLIARPDLEVVGRVAKFLREIAAAAPEQYYYHQRPGRLRRSRWAYPLSVRAAGSSRSLVDDHPARDRTR